MNDISTTQSAGGDDTCVVCGKDTTSGRGFMTLYVAGRPMPLCCPMCYKLYQEDPARYVSTQHASEVARSLGFSESK